MVDLFGDDFAPPVQATARASTVPTPTPTPFQVVPIQAVSVVHTRASAPIKRQSTNELPKPQQKGESFEDCVSSLRSLVFGDMSYSKNKKTADKARIANFREAKVLALGGKADRMAKHGAKHLKQMRQARNKKLKIEMEKIKTQDLPDARIRHRAAEAQNIKQNKLKAKKQRQQAAKLLGPSP